MERSKQVLAACGCNKPKKETSKCKGCGLIFCWKHVYSYVDGNNGAITRNSLEYCEPCYKERYKPIF